jgi:hypothetical protein
MIPKDQKKYNNTEVMYGGNTYELTTVAVPYVRKAIS